MNANDELKFVIGGRADYEWARALIAEHRLLDKPFGLLFSTVFGKLHPRELAEWIIEDRLPVRFQLQLHKYVWDPCPRRLSALTTGCRERCRRTGPRPTAAPAARSPHPPEDKPGHPTPRAAMPLADPPRSSRVATHSPSTATVRLNTGGKTGTAGRRRGR